MSKTTAIEAAVHSSRPGLELLRDLVHERTGLLFDEGRSEMFLDKLSPLIAMRTSDSIMDYYGILKEDSGSDEWPKVFDALTVQESFFWREMEQIRALVDKIVPRFFKAHPGDTLNIWSAACARGCEPLTIAMALEEAGWFSRERICIHASDASPRAIESARKGKYREHSFRRLPPAMREKYFVRGSGDEKPSLVQDKLHSGVRWQIVNLISEADLAQAPTSSPVIFCRNVFIYFSDFAVGKTVRSFAETMPRPGYLFVGMAESLMKNTSTFELCEIGDAFVHVRS